MFVASTPPIRAAKVRYYLDPVEAPPMPEAKPVSGEEGAGKEMSAMEQNDGAAQTDETKAAASDEANAGIRR